jgi:uncharacterized protein (DUF1501 family)
MRTAPRQPTAADAALTRRTLLQGAAAAGLAFLMPPMAQGGDNLIRAVDWTKTLILIELDGGNDGLNTVVPYGQAAYATARGSLAVDASQVLALDVGLGLNPMMSSLMPAWSAGDLAVVLGVGYPSPNRSHFRGIDIWNTGSDATQVLSTGWLDRIMAGTSLDPASPAHGVLLGRYSSNPLAGPGVRTLSMSSPASFISRSASVPTIAGGTGNPALDHYLDVQAGVVVAGGAFKTAFTTTPTFTTIFPTQSSLGRQAQYAAQILAAGLQVPVIKLSIGGFDNHANQRTKHDDLLAQVAESMAALRSALIEKGLWNRVMVMTYSEFGRRVNVNGSNGTDHGTAAPHLVLGGAVNGGLFGTQPSLSSLDSRGDLIFNTDFRAMFAGGLAFLGYDPAPLGAAWTPLALA